MLKTTQSNEAEVRIDEVASDNDSIDDVGSKDEAEQRALNILILEAEWLNDDSMIAQHRSDLERLLLQQKTRAAAKARELKLQLREVLAREKGLIAARQEAGDRAQQSEDALHHAYQATKQLQAQFDKMLEQQIEKSRTEIEQTEARFDMQLEQANNEWAIEREEYKHREEERIASEAQRLEQSQREMEQVKTRFEIQLDQAQSQWQVEREEYKHREKEKDTIEKHLREQRLKEREQWEQEREKDIRKETEKMLQEQQLKVQDLRNEWELELRNHTDVMKEQYVAMIKEQRLLQAESKAAIMKEAEKLIQQIEALQIQMQEDKEEWKLENEEWNRKIVLRDHDLEFKLRSEIQQAKELSSQMLMAQQQDWEHAMILEREAEKAKREEHELARRKETDLEKKAMLARFEQEKQELQVLHHKLQQQVAEGTLINTTLREDLKLNEVLVTKLLAELDDYKSQLEVAASRAVWLQEQTALDMSRCQQSAQDDLRRLHEEKNVGRAHLVEMTTKIEGLKSEIECAVAESEILQTFVLSILAKLEFSELSEWEAEIESERCAEGVDALQQQILQLQALCEEQEEHERAMINQQHQREKESEARILDSETQQQTLKDELKQLRLDLEFQKEEHRARQQDLLRLLEEARETAKVARHAADKATKQEAETVHRHETTTSALKERLESTSRRVVYLEGQLLEAAPRPSVFRNDSSTPLRTPAPSIAYTPVAGLDACVTVHSIPATAPERLSHKANRGLKEGAHRRLEQFQASLDASPSTNPFALEHAPKAESHLEITGHRVEDCKSSTSTNPFSFSNTADMQQTDPLPHARKRDSLEELQHRALVSSTRVNRDPIATPVLFEQDREATASIDNDIGHCANGSGTFGTRVNGPLTPGGPDTDYESEDHEHSVENAKFHILTSPFRPSPIKVLKERLKTQEQAAQPANSTMHEKHLEKCEREREKTREKRQADRQAVLKGVK